MPESEKEITELLLGKVKSKLTILFECSVVIRALYLTCRHNNYKWPPFSSEDLAQFLIYLLINKFHGQTNMPPIPELIVRFLIGSFNNSSNIISDATRKSNFLQFTRSPYSEWDDFYYLNFLPSNKLFHLTDSRQKAYAGALAEKRLNEPATILADCANITGGEIGYRPTFKFQSDTAKQRFISMKSLSNADIHPYSVTIFGFHKYLMGLGEDARRLFDNLTEIGYRVELFDLSMNGLQRDPEAEFYELFETDVPTSEIAIFCMPVVEMARLLPHLSSTFFSNRYVIGYWPWELSEFPLGWSSIIDLVDEIWASSNYLKAVYESVSTKRVHHVPPSIIVDKCFGSQGKSNFAIPQFSYFLTAFDFNSAIERKNPIGAVRAFKMAFQNDDCKIKLILKSINGQSNRNELSQLIAEINGDARIVLIDTPLSKYDLNNLIANSTALVSLHRSEGFGRFIAEAMLLNTPVISTNWSGSVDFVNDKTGFPVKYSLRPVGQDEYPNAAGVWAEPDLNDAARVLKSVASDSTEKNQIVKSAFSYVNCHYSKSKIKNILAQRMKIVSNNLKSAEFDIYVAKDPE